MGSSPPVGPTALSLAPTFHLFPERLHVIVDFLRRDAVDVRLVDAFERAASRCRRSVPRVSLRVCRSPPTLGLADAECEQPRNAERAIAETMQTLTGSDGAATCW